jgi:hypothetical protein
MNRGFWLLNCLLVPSDPLLADMYLDVPPHEVFPSFAHTTTAPVLSQT